MSKILPHVNPRRDSNVLHGTGSWTNVDDRRPWGIQDRTNIQRHWIRCCRNVVLDERLLHRHSRLGHLLFLHVNEDWSVLL